jgi:hypothetical protein
MQRPVAEAGTSCPLLKKDVSKVCHKCAWYTLVKGKNPQSEEIFDQWGCAIAWGPTLAINTAQAAHQGAAAITSFRNEVVKQVDQQRSLERL